MTPSAQLTGCADAQRTTIRKLRHFSVYRARVDTARALCIVATTATFQVPGPETPQFWMGMPNCPVRL